MIDRAEDIVPGILASVRANGREGEAEIIPGSDLVRDEEQCVRFSARIPL